MAFLLLTGGCLCGGVRYAIDRPLGMVVNCHCSLCRRSSGASFATSAVLDRTDFSVTCGEELITQFESTRGHRRHFCSRCGSPLYATMDAISNFLSVRCGTLDGDPGIRPSFHIHVGSRAPWVELEDALEKFQGEVDREHMERLYFTHLRREAT